MKKLLLLGLFIFIVGLTVQAIAAAPRNTKEPQLQAASIVETPTPVPLPTVTPTPTRWQDVDGTSTATIMMEKFVLDRLKAPSTAEFPSMWEYMDGQVIRNGQRYTFRSWVDSENGFGAMLRTRYISEIEQVEPGSWQLLSLETLDN